MKKLVFLCIVLITSVGYSFAQKADDVLGTWLNRDQDSKIQIFKSGNKYYGKIIWMKNPYEPDGKTLKKDHTGKTPILNCIFLSDFVFDEDQWEDGKLNDPATGKSYSGILKVKSNVLEMRGYIGFSLAGKSVYWTRVNS